MITISRVSDLKGIFPAGMTTCVFVGIDGKFWGCFDECLHLYGSKKIVEFYVAGTASLHIEIEME